MPTTTTTAPAKLLEAIDDLIEQRRLHVWLEYYDRKKKKRVRRKANAGKASLVGILEADAERDDDTAPKRPGGAMAGGFESRPPGKYPPRELLDALNRDLDVWLGWFGVEGWYSTTDKLRQIRDTLPDLEDPETIHECAREISSWLGRLRRYAGTERIFRPHASCPQCEKVGTITVWVAEGRTWRADRASCHACEAGWDTSNIGVLLAHIKRETRDLTPTATVDLVKREYCPRCEDEAADIGNGEWICVPCDLHLTKVAGRLQPATSALVHTSIG